MNVLCIYAHPNPKSFNHAILETVAKPFKTKGHTFAVRDLYGIRFDPVLAPADFEAMSRGSVRLDVAEEQRHIREAELIVFIYPVWWFSEPAILKGWIDRVFSLGFAFKLEADKAVGLLAGKKGAVFCTAGAGEKLFNTGFRTAMDQVFVTGALRSCGIEPILTRYLYTVDGATEPERATMLQQVKTDAEALAAGG
jgi:NAD(P)H dehydrogenase (quinone)